MSKVITSIKKNPKKKLYEVSFGLEKIVLSEDSFTNYFLYQSKEISPKEFLEMKNESLDEEMYKYALSLALKGAYSEDEVKDRLKKKYPEKDFSRVISRLKEASLLDDRELAKEYKEEKERQLYGSNRIKNDLLYKKRISQDIVNSLTFLDEEKRAKEALSSLEKRLEALPLKEKKRKALDFLLHRGFDMETSLMCISSLTENEEKTILKFEKDYDAVSRRLQNKWNGYEYKRRVYDTLIRKGYKKEMIDQKMGEHEYDD